MALIMCNTLLGKQDRNLSKTAQLTEGPGSANAQALGRIHAIVKHVGTSVATASLRYALGDRPTMSRNVRLKVPGLSKPTLKQMSVALRSVSRSRNIARSTRRRWRYRCGVSPNVARNVRMKWASDTPAIR